MNSPETYTLAFIFTNFPPEVSGSAQYNWERVQWLAEQGMYRVVVLAPDCQNTALLPSVPSHLSERLIIESYPSQPWIPYNIHYVPTVGSVRYINKKLAYYKPHLITLVCVELAFLCASWQFPGRDYAKENKIPYITEYQTDYYNFAGSHPAWKFLRNIFLRPLTKYFYHQFDATIAPSKLTNHHLQEMGIQNSLPISFFGIDISLYSPVRRNRDFLNTWLSADEKNNKILLFLGRLSFEKRVDLLIEAFGKLKYQDDNYTLIIAGDGPSSAVKKLKSLAKSIPNIHFTGFIHGEAKANLLASCDIFCNPSPYETFGRTVVEAMASGIPVVSVDSGAVSEYMINKVNGYLFQPDNVEGFVSTIGEALSNDNTEIIQKALLDAAQLSSEQGARNLNEFYRQLLIPMSSQNSLALL